MKNNLVDLVKSYMLYAAGGAGGSSAGSEKAEADGNSAEVEEDNKTVTLSPVDIMGDLNDMLGEKKAVTTTPKGVNDDIDLDLDMTEVKKDTNENGANVDEKANSVVEESEGDSEESEGVAEADKVEKKLEVVKTKEQEQELKEEKSEVSLAVDVEEMRKNFQEFASTQLKNAGIKDGEFFDSAKEGKPATQNEQEPTSEQEEPTPTPEQKQRPVNLKPLSLTEEQHSKIVNNSQDFAEFINDLTNNIASQVYQRVVVESGKTMKSFTANYISTLDATRQFYVDNPDLAKYKSVVSFVATKLGQQNPAMNRDEILIKTKEEARKLLQIIPGNKATVPEKNKTVGNGETEARIERTSKPAFASTGGRRQEVGKKAYKNKVGQELADMAPVN